MSISTGKPKSTFASEYESQYQSAICRARQRMALANDGPYFFRSLVWGLCKSGKYSDFTIRVKGSTREFHVHRAVICPQSGIFEAACRGQFIEASTNSMTLTDDDPEIVDRMITYLYTHRYDDAEDWHQGCSDNGIKRIRQHYDASGDGDQMPGTTNSRHICDRDFSTTPTTRVSTRNVTNATTEHSKSLDNSEEDDSNFKDTRYSPSDPPKSLYVYAIADKYLIHPLKDLARLRFSSWAYSHWWTTAFVAAAREIFNNETGNYNDLKEIIISTIALHADTLLCGRYSSRGSGSGIDNKKGQEKETDMDKFMQEYSEVSVEVLRRTLDRARIRQRGLEVDIADLESRVNALRVENKKIGVLQSRNHTLNKELLDIRMVVLAWKRDLNNRGKSATAGTSE